MSKLGTDARTGRRMDEVEHIRQSVRDILTTPIGSRVMRREYGSLLPDLIDHPGNPANRLRLMSATVMAIIRWEPRVSVRSARIGIGMDGAVTVDMEAVRRGGQRTGGQINLSVPLR
ncbi:MAG: GPW/gp25 family protein [Rhodocyclales bacterium]|nr:GPW/gp25 family protein [Rhodocyclales bacterium]